MLRRACASFLRHPQQQQQQQRVAAVALSAASRWCATTGNPQRGGNYNANFQNRNRGAFPRRVLPPAFDIVHWNDADIARGHLLRVIHQDSYIVLDYHRQSSPVKPEAAESENDGDAAAVDEAGAPQRQQQQRGGGHAERVVTVTLPPVYIARFLGVLEGRTEAVEVQSRFTNATFSKKAGSAAADKSFVLSCSSRRPTNGRRQTPEGQDVTEESVEWTVEMDPAESLMLHRFLTQALQYNTGFGRNV